MVQQCTTGQLKLTPSPTRRVRLTCPCCGYRIADASITTARIIRLDATTDATADLYIKCGRCKAEIAARLV